MNNVFVYGSLLRGLGNHGVLGESREVGSGMAQGSFEMISMGGFPGAYRVPVGGWIVGEVYECDADMMGRLDRLESNGSFYQRELVDVFLSNGDTVEAWVYLLMDPGHYGQSVVPGNDWFEFVEKKNQKVC